MDTIRWGIMGTGRIANKFAQDIAFAHNARAVAVGSRRLETAQAFGRRHSIGTVHGSYEALVADPTVDAIYVGTPHPWHCEHTLLALGAGKHVVCEKSFAMNAREAARMVHAAREKKRFLMEGMWTRFLPAIGKLRELVSSGIIGTLHVLQVDLGVLAPFDPNNRLYDKVVGGGALLDLGIYPISFAFMLFGTPIRTTGYAQLGRTDVDEQHAILMDYGQGRHAQLTGTFLADAPGVANLLGSTGRIIVQPRFHHPHALTVVTGGHREEIAASFTGGGFQFQITHASERIAQGALESEIMPLDETLAIMQCMDDLRAQWGLRYVADDFDNRRTGG